MTNKEVNPAREAAFRSLLKIDARKYTNIEVSTTIERTPLSDKDKALYTRLVYGVVERLITLDYVVAHYSSTPIEKIAPEALCALRLGIYQLLYMDRVPDFAAVGESVSLVSRKLSGFVNAILRSFIRDGKKIDFPKDDVKRISVTYSVPTALVQKMISVLEAEGCERFFEKTLEKEKIALHVNNLKISEADFCKKYGTEKSFVKNCVLSDTICGLDNGEAFVQDTASAFAASVLDAKEGETVVDTCAAPGGKSFAIALGMNNVGKVYSFDIHENKLSLIKKGMKSLGITIIETDRCDATDPRTQLIGTADRVLCDAPCSGLGVIGKKPDIKYKNLDAIAGLPSVQARVIRGAAQYVKRGGTLVYSTCTVLPEENEMICTSFLEENDDFELYPFEYKGQEAAMLTLYPHVDDTDGFFVCRMRRKQ